MSLNVVDIRKRTALTDTCHEIYLNGVLVEKLRNEPIGYVKMIARQYEAYGRRGGAWQQGAGE